MAETQTRLTGMLWLQCQDRRLLGGERIHLLERIGELGSIAGAATALGMSYRSAWDAVTDMNNLAELPLTRRQAGGRYGGSTELTEYGARLVAAFTAVKNEYSRLLDGLNTSLGDWDRLQALMRRFAMRTSARNQWQGKVHEVRVGPVNAEVIVSLNAVDQVVATVTRESVETLGLQSGRDVFALVKSSFILLGTGAGGADTTARNRLCGKIERVIRGEVSAEVTLALEGGKSVTATVTAQSVDALDLREGGRACALFKASHVIIGVN